MSVTAAPPVRRAAAQTARAWHAAMNAHDAAALRALLADDCAWTTPNANERGAEETVRTWRSWFGAVPDFELEILRELERADCAILQLRVRGTLRAAPPALFTVHPTPAPAATRRIDVPACAVLVVRRHLIARLWTYWDDTALTRPSTPPPSDF